MINEQEVRSFQVSDVGVRVEFYNSNDMFIPYTNTINSLVQIQDGTSIDAMIDYKCSVADSLKSLSKVLDTNISDKEAVETLKFMRKVLTESKFKGL